MTENPNTEPQTLSETLAALNDELMDTASQSAAQAFNMGCMLGGLGVVLAVGLATILSHWVTGMVALIISGMLAVSLANLVSSRSYQGNLKLAFDQHARPRLPEIQQRFDVSLAEIQQAAREELPAEAPLVQLLSNLRDESWEPNQQ